MDVKEVYCLMLLVVLRYEWMDRWMDGWMDGWMNRLEMDEYHVNNVTHIISHFRIR